MKNLAKTFLVSLLIAGFTSVAAHAQIFYVTLNSFTGEGNDDPEIFDIGTQFTLGSSNIVVSQLGVWGGGGSGSTQLTLKGAVDTSTTAYLWDSSKNLLGTVSIASGTPAIEASTVPTEGWAFAPIVASSSATVLDGGVELLAGQTYYVTNEATQNGYTRLAPSEITVGSDITETNIAYYTDTVGGFPSGTAGANASFGGNFVYTVVAPEPSTVALGFAGLAAIALVLRRRIAKI